VDALPIGSTIFEKVVIRVGGRVAVEVSVSALKQPWSKALERALHAETEERLVPETLQRS
jgi:hypothetical protein